MRQLWLRAALSNALRLSSPFCLFGAILRYLLVYRQGNSRPETGRCQGFLGEEEDGLCGCRASGRVVDEPARPEAAEDVPEGPAHAIADRVADALPDLLLRQLGR